MAAWGMPTLWFVHFPQAKYVQQARCRRTPNVLEPPPGSNEAEMLRAWKTGRNSRLFRKIITTHILLAIIPAILVTMFVIYQFQRNTTRQSYHLLDQNNTQREIIINERLDRDQDFFYGLISDRTFIRYAFVINDNTSGIEETRIAMSTQIENAIVSNDDIRAVNFIADNGNYVSYSRRYDSRSARLWSTQEEKADLLSQITDVQNLTYLSMRDLAVTSNRHDYVILMGLPVRNLYTKERCGVLVFAISADILQMESQSKESYGIHTLVVNQNNEIMLGGTTGILHEDLDTYLDTYRAESIEVRKVQMAETGWMIVNIIQYDAFYGEIYQFSRMVLIFYLVVTAAFFLITYRFISGYVKDMQMISEQIAAFDAGSDLMEPIELSADSDFYGIESSLQGMAERNNKLVRALIQKNDEVQRSEDLRRIYELKALEAQINPHFIYNTLDTINWMAIDNNEMEISNMLGALGSLLRYSVSNSTMLVLLRAEIDWLKKYIYLQKERFNNSFDCQYDISADAMDFPVYKTILQPLIENCIIHGFEGVKEGGLIRVTARVQEDGRLRVSVEDNGIGMPQETLEEIRHCVQEGTMDTQHIGISNIVNRLRIYYHGEAEIAIDCAPEGGTRIVMQIPYLERI